MPRASRPKKRAPRKQPLVVAREMAPASSVAASSTSVVTPPTHKGAQTAASSTPSIVFYNTLIGDKDLIEEYREVLLRLVAGEELRGMHYELKKMSGHRIYSLRLGSSRLLFGELKIKGEKKKVLVLLQLVSNHDYQKSILRDKRLVRNFMDNHDEDIKNAISAANENPEEWPSLELEGPLPTSSHARWMPPEINSLSLELLNGQCFWLGKEDQQAIHCTQLPLLLTGPSGAGKSSDAFFIMKRAQTMPHLIEPDQPRFREIIYLTQNANLVATHERLFIEALSPDGTAVHFITWDDWAKRVNPELNKHKWVGEQDFFTWYKEFVKSYNQQLKLAAYAQGWKGKGKGKGSRNTSLIPGPHTILSAHLVRQEMRTASGYPSLEAYGASGKHMTLLPESTSQPLANHAYIYLVLESWHRILHSLEQFDPAVMSLSSYAQNNELETIEESLIVADEATDFSWLQLKELALVAQMQIVYCAGPWQSLKNDISCIPYLKNLPSLLHNGSTMQHVELPFTHRVPPCILPLANLAAALAYEFGGASYSGQFARLHAAPSQASRFGDAWWLEAPSKEDWKRLRQVASTPQCLIVTHEEFFEEAQKMFPGASLILSPDKAQGLDADVVILYNYLGPTVFSEMSRKLPEGFQQSDNNQRLTVNPARIENCDTHFNRWTNGLFTSITRVRCNLVFVTPRKSAAPRLAAFIKANCTQHKLEDSQDLCNLKPATDDAWIERILAMMDQGLEAPARALYQRRFAGTPRTFDELLAEHRPALAPAPSSMAYHSTDSTSASTPPLVGSSSSTSTSVSLPIHPDEFVTNPRRSEVQAPRKHQNLEQATLNQALRGNVTHLHHWLKKPTDLMPVLSIEQLFEPIITSGQTRSLFGVLCMSSNPKTRGWLLQLLRCNPGIATALTTQLIELAKNPEQPFFMTTRAELFLLSNLPHNEKGKQVIAWLAEESKLSQEAVIMAAKSHLPVNVHKALTLSQQYSDAALEWERKLSPSERIIFERIKDDRQKIIDLTKDIWCNITNGQGVFPTNVRDCSIYLLLQIRQKGTFGLCANEQDKVLFETVLKHLGEMPSSTSRTEIADRIDQFLIGYELSVMRWDVLALTHLREIMRVEIQMLQTIYQRPKEIPASMISSILPAPNRILERDCIHLMMVHPQTELFVLRRHIHDEWLSLWGNEPCKALLRVFSEYVAEKRQEEDSFVLEPVLEFLMKILTTSSSNLTNYELIQKLLNNMLSSNKVNYFSEQTTLIYWAKYYYTCFFYSNDSKKPLHSKGRHRLFAPASSGQTMEMNFTCSSDGIAPIYKILQKPDSLRTIQNLIKQMSSVSKFLNYENLCQQLGGKQQDTSFLHWLCIGEEEHHVILENLLFENNKLLFMALKEAIANALDPEQYVHTKHADIMWMENLELTDTGRRILDNLAYCLHLPRGGMSNKLRVCQSPDFIEFIRNCHQRPYSEWKALIKKAPNKERAETLAKFMARETTEAMKWWQGIPNRPSLDKKTLFDFMLQCLFAMQFRGFIESSKDFEQAYQWEQTMAYWAKMDIDREAAIAILYGVLIEWLNKDIDYVTPLAGLLRAAREDLLKKSPGFELQKRAVSTGSSNTASASSEPQPSSSTDPIPSCSSDATSFSRRR